MGDPRSVILLPSSLNERDDVVQATKRILDHSGAIARIVTPRTHQRRLTSLVRPLIADPAWRAVPIDLPGTALRRVVLPAELVCPDQRFIVCDLDRVAATGPFILDLLARYLHPRDRLRVLATAQRQQQLAEINLAVPDSIALVCMSIAQDTIVALTTDSILGELLALALAEIKIARNVDFTGPWEDAVVQRATELELGVTVPSDITVQWDIDERVPESIAGIQDHIRSRLGLASR